MKSENILKEEIKNEQKPIDYIISGSLLLGSLGFLITGISTYTKINIIPFLNTNEILFFPQGITMIFYGTCGTLLAISQLIILILNIGEGYNEFNMENKTITIYRKNYPGKNSEIKLNYNVKDILRI
jgi:hypothetical protein